MVVVDNGSNCDELNPLRVATQGSGIHLIENGENLGIAEALNQGVRWAMSSDYPWVILFDQDSRITDGFMECMFAAWGVPITRVRAYVSIHPKYVHPETGLEHRVERAPDGGPIISITSGALMPIWVFDKIGGFASEYFIDWVDIEYCYRIRAAGFFIADSSDAVLLHASRVIQSHFPSLVFTFDPDTIARSGGITCRGIVWRYIGSIFACFQLWILKSMWESVRGTIKGLIVEDDRTIKFRNFILGTWDGLAAKMGKREGL